VRVVGRPVDDRGSAPGVEQAKAGVAMVIGTLEDAESRYIEDAGSD
jgi:hypothetical protein